MERSLGQLRGSRLLTSYMMAMVSRRSRINQELQTSYARLLMVEMMKGDTRAAMQGLSRHCVPH